MKPHQILWQTIKDLRGQDTNNYYHWAANQLSHKYLGFVVAGGFALLGLPLIGLAAATGCGLFMECAFHLRAETKCLRDSVVDVIFWTIGGATAVGMIYQDVWLFFASVGVGGLLVGAGPWIAKD